MFFNKSNQTFEFEGKKYTIGDKVFATETSGIYEGLIGYITEIRDGDDRETENEAPDIYCTFFEPIIPFDVEQIEMRFSKAYGEPKKIADIALDIVIMAPEMIEVISEPGTAAQNQDTVYVVSDDWADNDEYDSNVEIFNDLKSARTYMREQVRKMVGYGGLFDRRGDADCVEESSDMFYEIYIEGFYASNHYSIRIQEKRIE